MTDREGPPPVSTPLRVLIVEDNEDDLLLLLRKLRQGGYDPDHQWVRDLPEIRPALETGRWEAVISDFDLEDYTGLDVLAILKESGFDIPFILVSGAIGEETAVEAMRAGAHDYIMKDKLARLIPALQRELGDARIRRMQRRAEAALAEERERAEVTLASIGEGVLRTDAAGRIEYLNSTAEKLTGWTNDEARGRIVDIVVRIIDAETRGPLRNPVESCLRQRRQTKPAGERLIVSRGGAEKLIEDSAAPIFGLDGTPTGAVVILQDRSLRRQMQKRMEILESHDLVTGLINRRAFEASLTEVLDSPFSGQREHALCFVDLDKFKVINDTTAHSVGDTMLGRVSRRLRREVGDGGIVARLGGDEFGILLFDTEPAEALEFAQSLLGVVAGARFEWEGQLCKVTASIGVASTDALGKSPETLLSDAVAACYLAKERGGNRVHQHRPKDAAVARHHRETRWISRLNTALEQGLFRLLAQPIHSLGSKDEKPVLSEVLLRLQQEDGGLVPPADFMGAAERFHLMPDIDRWVVGGTLGCLASDCGRNTDMSFAVNLSGQSLSDESFLQFVTEEFSRTGVSPSRICFEITETAAIQRLPEAARFISVLQGLGCRFALDDFGTGFNSFGYLRTLPVDFLKIDGSFVQHLSDPIQLALVESINHVGHLMGIHIIAESIEDEQTAEILRKMGVDFGQGHWLAYPEPLEKASPKAVN